MRIEVDLVRRGVEPEYVLLRAQVEGARLHELLFQLLPLGEGEGLHRAPMRAAREHDLRFARRGERLAELRGEAGAPLRVDRVNEGAEEHATPRATRTSGPALRVTATRPTPCRRVQRCTGGHRRSLPRRRHPAADDDRPRPPVLLPVMPIPPPPADEPPRAAAIRWLPLFPTSCHGSTRSVLDCQWTPSKDAGLGSASAFRVGPPLSWVRGYLHQGVVVERTRRDGPRIQVAMKGRSRECSPARRAKAEDARRVKVEDEMATLQGKTLFITGASRGIGKAHRAPRRRATARTS